MGSNFSLTGISMTPFLSNFLHILMGPSFKISVNLCQILTNDVISIKKMLTESKKFGKMHGTIGTYINGPLFLEKLVYVWFYFQILNGTFLPKPNQTWVPLGSLKQACFLILIFHQGNVFKKWHLSRFKQVFEWKWKVYKKSTSSHHVTHLPVILRALECFVHCTNYKIHPSISE